MLAALGGHGSVVLWDTTDGKLLRSIPEKTAEKKDINGFPIPIELENRITQFALSPDHKLLAAAFYGKDGPVCFWETKTGKKLRTFQGSDYAVRDMAFSPDGRLLALASQNALRVWEVSTAKELWQLPIDGNQLFGISFSPDSRILAGGLIFMVRMWDAATGREISPTPEHRQGIGFVALSPDGRTVITEGQSVGGVPGSGGPGEDAPSLRYWQATTGMALLQPPGQGRRFPPLAALSADGRTFAGWGKDHSLQLWDVTSGKELHRLPIDGEPEFWAISPNGTHLLVGGKERNRELEKRIVRFRVWDVSTGKPLGEPVQAHQGTVWSVAFSPDGTQFATVGSTDRTIRLWEVATQRQHRELKIDGDTGALWHVAYSPDGKSLAGAGNNDEIQFWEVATGKLQSKIAGPQARGKLQSGVYALLFTPDGKTLIATDNFGKIFFWDVATGALRLEWKAHQFRVSVLAISSDGKVLLSRGATTALVWDVAELLKGNHP